MKVMDIKFFSANGSVRTVPVDTLYNQKPRPQKIYGPNIKIGLIISTYASVPYVHLGLESWKKNYSNVKMLVHDDCSPDKDKLKNITHTYNADFETTEVQRGHTVGDLTAFYGGLRWAEKNELDMLVKFSRRFVPLYDWTSKLIALSQQTQAPTFSNICQNLNWGFRTECVAMHVPSWLGVINDIAVETNNNTTFCEGFIHGLAKKIETKDICIDYANYLKQHPKADWCAHHIDWDIMGTNRIKKVRGLLWHHSCKPEDYAAVAKVYELPYTIADFTIPDSHLFSDTRR